MIKTLLLITSLFFTACVNKHGISASYYSDCKEYYDMQGFYHKKCGEDDIITYKEMGEKAERFRKYLGKEKEEPKGNVW